jgi:putative transposase
MRHDFGAESSRPASLLCTLRTHQSPSEWQHSLPACLLGFDRTGLTPAGFHQEVSPSHLRFPLFQVLPSAIFTVPTLTFGVLYCFFVIRHGRRKILRCNVTRNPSAFWIVQQMREAWPYARAQKFLLFDRDAKFGNEVICAAKNLGADPVRTAFRSPWQNGTAERWVGSCRRDLLDHVIVLNERHLKRLMREYIRYYHEDRTHLGLAKDTPVGRPVARASADRSRVQSFARLGGLHHRYILAA